MASAELISEPVQHGLAEWERDASKVLCNFDGDERQQFALRMLCMASSAGGDAALNKDIAIKYWMVHEVEFVNEETGEVVQTFRTVLVTPKMETFSFVSQGVAKGIQSIYNAFGSKPLDPPLVVKIQQKTTAKKRRVYVLIPSGLVPEAK